MRHERSVTSISWIPSEAMTGPMRVPMDLGIGHYDPPPPDPVDEAVIDELRRADGFRFANRLAAWVDVEDDQIVGAGYSGGAVVGSTTARLGVSVTFAGVAFPILQEEPVVAGGEARFVQTAGGRTGAPLPRRIDRPPYVRITAPTAWTTLGLTVRADGTSSFDVVGASPFPRHWIYGADGSLAAKSGVIDFAEWTRLYDHTRTPWHNMQRAALVAAVESEVERRLSATVMGSKPKLERIDEGRTLIEQGQPGGTIYLILDGMLHVHVDGECVAELGPGAIVGERAVLEGGKATATVTAETPVRVAAIPADAVDRAELEEVASHHRSEGAAGQSTKP